jgi:hypothetical protein
MDIESSPLPRAGLIAQVERPPIIERNAERLVTPHGVVLVFVVFVVLTLGTIKVLFGGRFYEWPQSGRMT